VDKFFAALKDHRHERDYMKAYIYSGKGDTHIEEADKPVAPVGGALAKIRFVSICGTDLIKR